MSNLMGWIYLKYQTNCGLLKINSQTENYNTGVLLVLWNVCRRILGCLLLFLGLVSAARPSLTRSRVSWSHSYHLKRLTHWFMGYSYQHKHCDGVVRWLWWNSSSYRRSWISWFWSKPFNDKSEMFLEDIKSERAGESSFRLLILKTDVLVVLNGSKPTKPTVWRGKQACQWM